MKSWVFVVLLGVVYAKEIPSFIPVCRRHSPELSTCIQKATAVVRPHIAKGIKELNIPAVEPLTIPMIKLEQGTHAVNYKATLTNVKVFGLSGYKFRSIVPDLEGQIKQISGVIELPRIRLEADYAVNGKALLVPVQGKGLFTANITNCKADALIRGKLYKKKGLEYFHSDETVIKLQFEDAKAHFENTSGNDKALSRTTTDFLNNNALVLFNEVKPAIEAVVGMLVDDIASKIFKQVPYDKLFPK